MAVSAGVACVVPGDACDVCGVWGTEGRPGGAGVHIGLRCSVPAGWNGEPSVRGYVCWARDTGTTWTAGVRLVICGVRVVGSVILGVAAVTVVGSDVVPVVAASGISVCT